MDILLVDDDETLRQSLQLLLQSEGYSVTEAASGNEALEKARLHYYDLVLCDVRMPGIDGIETIRQLCGSIADAHFVVMTGYASEEAPIEALRLGVDDYLFKPFDIPLFLGKLRALARRRKRTSERASPGLWNFLASAKEHIPALAARCQRVEEECLRVGTSQELPADKLDLLRLASWLYPLGEGSRPEDESEPSEASEFTDELALLIRRAGGDLGQDELADILRAALSKAVGSEPAEDLPDEVDQLQNQTGADPQSLAETNRGRPFSLVVHTLGKFKVAVDGREVDRRSWQSLNARLVFVYLLERGGQSVPEDRIATQFWPGSPPQKAHRALVSSIHRARKALGNSDLIVRYDGSYGVARDCDYWLDSARLVEAYQEGTHHLYQGNPDEAKVYLQQVLDLYAGPYLDDCQDDWCRRIRDDLRMKAVDSAEKLAALSLTTEPTLSEQLCRRALRMEPTSEPAWSTLLRALSAQQRRGEVETTYHDCVQVLQEELQLKPGPGLRQSYQESLKG